MSEERGRAEPAGRAAGEEPAAGGTQPDRPAEEAGPARRTAGAPRTGGTADAAPAPASADAAGTTAPAGEPSGAVTGGTSPDAGASAPSARATAPNAGATGGPAETGAGVRARLRRPHPVRLGPRSLTALVVTAVVGVAAFGWPFLAPPESAVAAHSQDAPWLFAGLLLILVAVVAAALSEAGLGPKAVAMLGVLAAAGAALRPVGTGTAGLEPMFFLMVLSGRVLGPGFGFALGSTTMFASALLTGGVGPWLPFQMLAMGWFAMGAGLLPERPRGRAELALLAGYGCVASFAYGTVMNLAGWPFMGELASNIAFRAEDPMATKLAHFVAYCLATSLGWDLGRALCTVLLTLLLGPAVLKALRRATRRARFETAVTFAPGRSVKRPT